MTDAKKIKAVEMKSDAAEIKKCFVIMPIADHPDYESGHFDRVYEYLIKPACITAGYTPIRADDTKASNLIMFDILKKITECDMAICDISSRNANVFYELGLRQAFNKKTIMITDGLLPAPFDISAFRYVPYSPTLRVDTVEKEKPAIVDMLRETQNLPEDDVNSIIKLLQIQPAKVDNINLNPELTVFYDMFLRLQAQISEIKNTSRNGITPQTLSLKKGTLLTPANTEHVSFSGLSLFTLLNSFPEKIGLQEYGFNGKYLGNIEMLGPEEITFINEDGKISIPRNNKTLSEILAL